MLPRQNKNSELKYFANHNIHAVTVICLDPDGNKLGQLPFKVAMEKARSFGLDLVQISASKDLPVCKILDFGKFKYEQSLKNKEQLKKQRENEIKRKEIQFRPVTSDNDLQTKAEHVKQFLKDGFEVKLNLKFKGQRELSHQNVGQETLVKFLTMLPAEIRVLQKPNLEGKNITCLIKL